jgi:bifunctional non-homologous end joining protein LigD
LRHPSFHGLREDKPARAIVRERARALARNARGAHASRSRSSGAGRSSRSSAASAPEAASAQAPRVAGVAITHPHRVLYAKLGLTKLELARYYESVAEHILPHLALRPLSLVRCPQGSAAGCFYQKHRTDDLPASIGGIRLREKEKSAVYPSVRDAQGLIALVQRGVLELHPWGARADQLERPDRLVLDLDPGPDVPWARVVRAAHELRALAAQLELESFVRTTGGKGLHVVLPIERRNSWEAAKGFAHSLAQALARRAPRDFVLVATKSKRAGRIFLDYLRNGRGATAVASYSTRAAPGATVATPLAWEELDARLDPARFDARSVPRRIARWSADPWRGFFELRQSLTRRVLAEVERL